MRKIILSDKDVLEIIDLLKNSDKSYDYISAKYKVKHNHISDINVGKRYEHLTKKEDLPIRKVQIRGTKKSMLETRLSKKDIEEIVNLIINTNMSFEDIANNYNVNRQVLGRINSGNFDYDFLGDITFPLRTKHVRHDKGKKSLKLSEKDILEIAKMMKEGKVTFKEIAEKFSVSLFTINRINGGHRYLDVLKDETFPLRKEQIRPTMAQTKEKAK